MPLYHPRRDLFIPGIGGVKPVIGPDVMEQWCVEADDAPVIQPHDRIRKYAFAERGGLEYGAVGNFFICVLVGESPVIAFRLLTLYDDELDTGYAVLTGQRLYLLLLG